MNNVVELEFDNTIRCVAGFEKGVQIYNKYLNGKLNYNIDFYIKFPDNIISVSTSFIQGLFENILKVYDREIVIKNLHIISVNNNLELNIKKRLIV